MEPTLKWENGRCTNAPEGLQLRQYRTAGGAAWSAQGARALLESNGPFPTAEAAQADCEATLWAFGVIPLPEYFSGMQGNSVHGDFCEVGSVCLFVAEHGWNIRSRGGFLANGPRLDKDTAETILRALVAAEVRKGINIAAAYGPAGTEG